MDLDRSKGLLLLLEAAEVLSEARDIGVICETPTVAQYEEVVTGPPAPGFQNRDSSFQSNLSFENIVASTPIKEFRDPHILPALDLSLSFVEESPLDLSLRSNDVDIPLDLAPVCRQERIACAEADECLPLNLAAVKGTVSGSPALHQFNHDTQHAEACSPDMNTDRPETSCRLESSVEDNSSPKSSSGKNNHRPLVSNPPTPAVRDSLETINQVNNSVILSPKNDANHSDPSLNPHETNTIPVQLSVNKPTERAQYKEVPQAADDWDPGSEDEDDDDRQIGDATFLNNFSVHEYFEVYRNNDLLGDDEDDVIDERTDDPDKCPSPRPSAADDPGFDQGFDDLNKENVNRRSKPTARKRVENRNRREKGLEYYRYNGVKVAARCVKQACSCSKLHCDEKYPEDIRKKILENFLKLSFSAQNQFLSCHISVSPVTSHTVINSRREYTVKYFLPGVGGMVRVCKAMFLATLDVTSKKIRCQTLKKLDGSGISADDKRAQNTNRNPISMEVKAYIEKHILSYPAYTSHYTREKSTKLYLSSDLNITKMYEMYKTKCSQDGMSPVHYNSYRLIFKQFNMSFRKPKADTCCECDRLNILVKQHANTAELETVLTTWREHQDHAQRMYTAKKKDVLDAKTDRTVYTASFDLQKCLPTPHLQCGQAFYSRQLYTLNLTVFETHQGRNSARCFLWDESKARRGSQEIGSCVLMTLRRLLNEDSFANVRTVNLYSDRCGGQNHNMTMCMMISFFIEECVRAQREMTIRHNFMVSGHSHMEVDSIHAAIERAKKVNNMDIETPRDWAVLISQVKRKVPFHVTELEQIDFVALKSLQSRYKRPKHNSSGQPIKFKQIMQFEYRTVSPGVIFYKMDITEENFSSFSLGDEQHFRNPDLPLPTLLPIEKEPIPLPKEKLEDLRKLLPFIKNKRYYETLLKNLVAPKRGRKRKLDQEDHFDADLDAADEDWPVEYLEDPELNDEEVPA